MCAFNPLTSLAVALVATIAQSALAQSGSKVDLVLPCTMAKCDTQLGPCTADPACLKALGLVQQCGVIAAGNLTTQTRCQNFVIFQNLGVPRFMALMGCAMAKCMAPPQVPAMCSCPRPTKLDVNVTAKSLEGKWTVIKVR